MVESHAFGDWPYNGLENCAMSSRVGATLPSRNEAVAIPLTTSLPLPASIPASKPLNMPLNYGLHLIASPIPSGDSGPSGDRCLSCRHPSCLPTIRRGSAQQVHQMAQE